jgi:DNA-binding transcriptional MerR regulator/quercetin dioxygenase-like cupin family protein
MRMSQHMEEVTFTIKEVAQQIGVTPATIRNWEKQGLFTARRGNNNYRVYNFDDIRQLERIRFYLYTQKINSAGIRSLMHSSYPAKENGSALKNRFSKRFMSRKWKESREEAGLTLEEVSGTTGISLSYLSKIENGNANPSIEVLKNLAQFYNKNILHFFRSETEMKHIPPNLREAVDIDIPGVQIDSLVGIREHVMQPMLYRIQPGCGITSAHAHEGEEFLFVLRGTVEMELNNEEIFILKPQSSLYFKSSAAHRWRNAGSETAEIIWVHVPFE